LGYDRLRTVKKNTHTERARAMELTNTEKEQIHAAIDGNITYHKEDGFATLIIITSEPTCTVIIRATKVGCVITLGIVSVSVFKGGMATSGYDTLLLLKNALSKDGNKVQVLKN
jgi:hypothetical protein